MPASLSSLPDGVRPLTGGVGPAVAGAGVVGVPGALAPLLDGGGLPRGEVVTVEDAGYLAWALLGALGPEDWAAVVGVPDVGIGAAAGLGVVPERLVVVQGPGEQWHEITTVLAEAVAVVLVRPPGPVPVKLTRRLAARWRASRSSVGGGAAIILVGPWEHAQVRLSVRQPLWYGLDQGRGHLTCRSVRVVAERRGQGARPRVARVWLPAPDGQLAALDQVELPLWCHSPHPARQQADQPAGARHSA